MQAMGQHMDFAVCPGHHVPVHPDKPVALVECHTHFRQLPVGALFLPTFFRVCDRLISETDLCQ